MIELNKYVDEFVGGNWLAILVFLALLKGIARQSESKPLRKIYMILQDVYKVVRPGSEIEPPPKMPEIEPSSETSEEK